MAESYFIAEETEKGIQSAYVFVESEFGMPVTANPDVVTIRHGLLSVDDARRLRSMAELSPTRGETKVLIISATRLFHEAQNALLKLFEEPPAGTILVLVVPTEGILLPTLRSRLTTLSSRESVSAIAPEVQEFIAGGSAVREKIFTKIVDRSKSDNDDEKQAARLSAIKMLEGFTRIAHAKWLVEKEGNTKDRLLAFLDDMNRFLPILHERSAPLKLIFEHILLTVPDLV